MEPHRLKLLHAQGPVARIKWRNATQILRAGNVLPNPRGNPRKWGPGPTPPVRGRWPEGPEGVGWATMSTKCPSGAVPGGALPNPSLLPTKPSEAGSPGRGGARERTQFSPPGGTGGNGVEWTQGELARRDKRRWPGPLRRRAAMGKGTRRPQAAKSPAKTSRSGAPRSSRPTRMQEKDYFFPCPSRAAKLWLIRSPELWMSWSMDWYRTG